MDIYFIQYVDIKKVQQNFVYSKILQKRNINFVLVKESSITTELISYFTL
jgi:hypothetical protein